VRGALEDLVARARALLAEDNATVAERLRTLLAPEFDVVETVRDGTALIDAALSLAPDVILSDIGMPGLNGLGAARIILTRQPAARIVFITVHAEPAVVRSALLAGACGYVLKGDAGDELLPALRAVLGGGQYVSTRARAALERSGPPL
jgi:DNA-binding NarL/FixJ family response regulator